MNRAFRPVFFQLLQSYRAEGLVLVGRLLRLGLAGYLGSRVIVSLELSGSTPLATGQMP